MDIDSLNRNKAIGQYSGLMLGGLAMALGAAPVGWSAWAWIAQIPLWGAILHRPGMNWRQQLITAIAWGGGFYGGALWWITGVHPMTWLGVPWLASLAIALACWIAITAWGVLLVWGWLGLMGWGLGRTKSKVGWILWGAVSWAGLEILWSHSILWWSPLAYTQSPGQLAILQWGQWMGPAGLSGAIAAVNGVLAVGLMYSGRQRWSYGALALGLITLLYLGGMALYQRPLNDRPDQRLTVGVIQGNIPNELKFNSEGWKRAIAGYSTGYETLAAQGVDGVLTPEGSLPYLWETIRRQSDLYHRVKTQQIPLWLGAYDRKGTGYTNSLLSLDGQGQLLDRYDKVKLVPLGEYIPLAPLFGSVIQRLSPLKDQLIPGDRPEVLQTPLGPAVVSICYESAFPHLFRTQLRQGGQFILSSANNAHYHPTMAAQHHALDVMRAIEGDRWVARATNTGYSAFISPRGDTLWLSDLNRYQYHQETLYRRQTLTPYTRWGDWPVLILWTPLAITFLRRQC